MEMIIKGKPFMTDLTARKGYFFLALSILFEQIAAGLMEASDGFTRPMYTLGLIICLFLTYFFFGRLLTVINLSISYATWTAVGTVGATLIGLFFFGQRLSLAGWIGIGLICIGVFLLNLLGTPKEKAEEAAVNGEGVRL